MTEAAARLGAEEFISFTTFRRTGEAVPTPVWVVPLRDGERIGFYTTMGTGKTKRLRHTSRVTVQPCGRRGTPTPGTEPVEGIAEMVQGGADFDEVQAAVRARYGWQATAFRLVGRLVMRRKGRTYGDTVILVTPEAAPA
ncbi:PPOX class F420-dependent oxidoreductase [Serinicoccus kebangsaanensis]|uniref:PPOX class F420-dependent oxidoreductase n=1 Tax=Serinicoccus kebangsaanensis TaxID=2602069 RepID=UPI00124E649E|nr:PPOX class F420-dependent oxidoreductase [Serinicoccus kebangsaanensis]